QIRAPIDRPARVIRVRVRIRGKNVGGGDTTPHEPRILGWGLRAARRRGAQQEYQPADSGPQRRRQSRIGVRKQSERVHECPSMSWSLPRRGATNATRLVVQAAGLRTITEFRELIG